MKTNKRMISFLIAVASLPLAAGETIGNTANPQAIKEVVEGKRGVANAAWWGFNEEDSTEALQAASS